MKLKLLFPILFFTLLFANPLTSNAKTAQFAYTSVLITDTNHKTLLTNYRISGEDYINLYELAELLDDGPNHFNVTSNNKNGTSYTITKKRYPTHSSFKATDKMVESISVSSKKNVTLVIDGKKKTKKAYVIKKQAFFSVKELGKLFNFSVTKKKNTLSLKNKKDSKFLYQKPASNSYSSNELYFSWNNKGLKKNATMINNGNGTFSIFDGDTLTYTTYSKQFKKLSSIKIKKELPIFGTFYSGEKYNYIATGQNNPKEKNIEVIRIVKYDKKFKRISAASIKGNAIHTVEPFRSSGNGGMVESGNILTYHTAKLRYTSSDGIQHQSQLTMKINTNTMKIVENVSDFPWNHVSHSFDQFLLSDNGNPVYLDLGDAYPRSIVIQKQFVNNTNLNDTIDDWDSFDTDDLNIFNISGKIGNNDVGVSIGGFNQSNTHYLVAFNSLNQSAWKNIYKTAANVRRTVYLYGANKNLTATNKTIIYNYFKKNYTSSQPVLVKINANKFVVLWNEYKIIDDDDLKFNQLKYVYVDGSGKKISSIYKEPTIKLSDTDPILVNNELWIPLNTNHYFILQKLKLK